MLSVRNLTKSFGDLKVLDRLDLEAGEGEILALVGPSGCGKSTLLHIVAGLTGPDSGTAETGGARVGYVFQEDRLLPWLTARENVAVVGEEGDGDAVQVLLEAVGLAGFGDYYPDEMSGGMRQRCALARAYHYRCDLLLLDEPFKSLDYGMRADMLELLLAMWKRRRTTTLFVTHEVDEALRVANRVAVLSARPARVRAEFGIGDPGGERDMDGDDIKWIRQEILGLFDGQLYADAADLPLEQL